MSRGARAGLTIRGSVGLYSEPDRAERWLRRFEGAPWSLVCTLAFTETALIPGISAAGKTPSDRRWTAQADAEFLVKGLSPDPSVYSLPPLDAGLSPVLISRALTEVQNTPIAILDAGLLNSELASIIPLVSLGGEAARCLSTGQAIAPARVSALFEAGLAQGQRLAEALEPGGYLVLGECVVGGTTTALGLLTGLGVDASGCINSSHPRCNHDQKQALVRQGLARAGLSLDLGRDPLGVVAALGDPMQIVVTGLAIAASRRVGVLLAGGTQMLAVYGLIAALYESRSLEKSLGKGWELNGKIDWDQIDWDQIVVGTTRWVAEDPTGDTLGLVQAIAHRFAPLPPPMLLATQLSFAQSHHKALRLYEAGFVKEGVAAGGCAIATALRLGWNKQQLREGIDGFCDRYYRWRA